MIKQAKAELSIHVLHLDLWDIVGTSFATIFCSFKEGSSLHRGYKYREIRSKKLDILVKVDFIRKEHKRKKTQLFFLLQYIKIKTFHVTKNLYFYQNF
jgi:hypothetical protein